MTDFAALLLRQGFARLRCYDGKETQTINLFGGVQRLNTLFH